MKKFLISAAMFTAIFAFGSGDNKMYNEPWKTSRQFTKITHSSGAVSYLLTTKLAHNQQCFYFTENEMTDDGRFLVVQLSDKEPAKEDANNKLRRTVAVIDFKTDEFFTTDLKTTLGADGANLDSKRGIIYCFNAKGMHAINLAKGERTSKLIVPMPEEIKALGKDVKRYSTHLSHSPCGTKFFLDITVDDRFFQGVLDIKTKKFTTWGETPFFCNHGQFNPVDPTMALCAWEVDYVDKNGVLHHIKDHKEEYYPRLWLMNENGKRRMVPPVTNYATHEAWANDGKGFFYCSTKNNQGMIYHDLATGLQRQIMAPVWLPKENRAASASHGDMSADNRHVICDIAAGVQVGYPWRLAFGNTLNGKVFLIYDDGVSYNPPGVKSVMHPHPHPHFIYHDKAIISTFMRNPREMDIIITPVDQLIEKVK